MKRDFILVTGAAGFIGSHITELLSRQGYRVKAFVRHTSNTENLDGLDVEKVFGDMQDRESLEKALSDVSCVIHAAADTSGTYEGGRDVTIAGTRMLVELCAAQNVERLIYISSCSVYRVAGLPPKSIIDESGELEPRPMDRGAYSWAKLEAEKLVLAAKAENTPPAVCLRPGFVYGDGGELINPMIGIRAGKSMVIALGSASLELPAVHVENVALAVAACLKSDIALGKTYNVVDSEKVTKQRYLNHFVRRRVNGLRVVYIPMPLLRALVRVQELLFKFVGREPVLSMYRLMSSQNPIHISADRIQEDLGWSSEQSFEKAC